MAQRITVRELITKFIFEGDASKVKSFDRALSAAKVTAAAIGIAAIGAGAALLGMARQTADAGDELISMSLKTGLAVEAIQELRGAADLLGSDAASLDDGLKKLANSTEDFINGGGEAKDTLLKMGFSAKSFIGVPLDQRLALIADELVKLPDGAAKVAATMNIMGRSADALIPIFAGGAAGIAEARDQIRSYGVMSAKTAAEGERFNDNLLLQRLALVGLRNTLVSGYLPALNTTIERVDRWYRANRDVINQRIDRAGRAIGEAIGWTSDKVADLNDGMERLDHWLGGGRDGTAKWGGVLSALRVVLAIVIGQLLKMLSLRVGALALDWGGAMAVLKGAFGGAAVKAALMTLAVAGLAIVLEDLYRFFTGKSSAIADGLKTLATEMEAQGGRMAPFGRILNEALDLYTPKNFFTAMGFLLDDFKEDWAGMRDSVVGSIDAVVDAYRRMDAALLEIPILGDAIRAYRGPDRPGYIPSSAASQGPRPSDANMGLPIPGPWAAGAAPKGGPFVGQFTPGGPGPWAAGTTDITVTFGDIRIDAAGAGSIAEYETITRKVMREVTSEMGRDLQRAHPPAVAR